MASIARLAPRRTAIPQSKVSLPLRSISSTPLFPVPTQSRSSQAPKLRTPHTPTRQYHSPLHPRLPPHEYTNSQTAILTAALVHVPTHGFTATSLTLGAQDAGFLSVSTQLLPRAEFDLVLFWLASRRGLLRAKVEEAALFPAAAAARGLAPQDLSVDDKVRILVLERLRLNREIKAHWADALAQMSLLGNIPLSLAELHALANDIVSLAGDTAVDASWYTRRAAVAGIYASAEVVMTRDPTEEMSETAEFVARRFEDRDALKLKVDAVSQCLSFWGNSVLGVGRSYGLKI
ncbi:hypothetical protein N7468_005041 [Penicillium chermesinum]|uniref:Ubiquinone biosynthesis protein n=1 Tax=Penicillium chermesinum TaxID=63820 RepID=A0A9W9NYQ5_9EURO|nr:uncharacterized protein N7468_005041 [Penicillium chermesinum]KAJ5232085.1 hypothetical protein N7468_005041 [Penicillium chermesinum]